jgi:hypothetical protein
MASGKGADCGRIRKEKSKNGRLWGEGRTVRRKMNGVGKRSGLRTDPQGKREKRGGDGAERSREGATIKRVLEDEKKRDKTSRKV